MDEAEPALQVVAGAYAGQRQKCDQQRHQHANRDPRSALLCALAGLRGPVVTHVL